MNTDQRELVLLKSDLEFIISRMYEFMNDRDLVVFDDPLLKDLLNDYESLRNRLTLLDKDLFGSLKQIDLGHPITNQFAATKPFYTSSNFHAFEKEVLKALKNLTVLEQITPVNQLENKNRMKPKKTFLALSFEDKDKKLNGYFKDILSALRIGYETGESYSKDTIPDKIKKRIESANILIAIFVRRYAISDGSFTTASWLTKELSYAQGKGKEVIALVEIGIKDIAGLNMEKEIIFFKRDNQTSMQEATIKFLQAIKEHELV